MNKILTSVSRDNPATFTKTSSHIKLEVRARAIGKRQNANTMMSKLYIIAFKKALFFLPHHSASYS